jgi:DNA invertase Pin-like site-specific DNA recombinase
MGQSSFGSSAGGRRGMEFMGLDQQPLISGRSADPKIGEFSGGTAFAKQSAQEGDPGESRLLVLDRGRQRLFWVGESEIDSHEQARRPRAIGYVSVSADANGSTQSKVEAQTLAIRRACASRGLELVRVVRDLDTAPGGDQRPGLRHVLEQIAAGEASCMVIQGLECLGGSASAVGTLVSWFDGDERRLVAADLDLDTGTPTGKVAVRALAAAGQMERRKLAECTRRGLAAARAKGAGAGRPSVADRPELRERIAVMRAEGMTLQAIADKLNDEGVATLRGGTQWRPSSVQAAAGYKRPGRVRGLEDLPGPSGLRPTGT